MSIPPPKKNLEVYDSDYNVIFSECPSKEIDKLGARIRELEAECSAK